jgi:hypothetical protein
MSEASIGYFQQSWPAQTGKVPEDTPDAVWKVQDTIIATSLNTEGGCKQQQAFDPSKYVKIKICEKI